MILNIGYSLKDFRCKGIFAVIGSSSVATPSSVTKYSFILLFSHSTVVYVSLHIFPFRVFSAKMAIFVLKFTSTLRSILPSWNIDCMQQFSKYKKT